MADPIAHRTDELKLARDLEDSAERVERYLEERHLRAGMLVGPDPVGKVHWRVTRFLRSYLPFLGREDAYVYVQAQGHWIQGLRRGLEFASGDRRRRRLELIRRAADGLIDLQHENGAWIHPPILGRRNLISTVEGTWGALGLLAAFEVLQDQRYLDAAGRWYGFQCDHAGFIESGGGLAARYYSGSSHLVPNVTTMTVWLSGELFRATGREEVLQYTPGMLDFLASAQLPSGELPYALDRHHFMCYQYNSFEALDLMAFELCETSLDSRPILRPLTGYLKDGVGPDGACRYDCHRRWPEVYYWTAALAAALTQAAEMGLIRGETMTEQAFRRVFAAQEKDGRFPFSRRNYRWLCDRRSYPRQQAMMMNCLRIAWAALRPAHDADAWNPSGE